MVTDPIGDMLTQIRNASMVGKKTVSLPYSGQKHAVAQVLSKEGYVGDVSREGEGTQATLIIAIKYDGKTPAITGIKRVSKPGLRWYVNKKNIPTVLGGMGTTIVSTPQGVISGKEAKKRGIGGELICTIW